MEPGLLSEVVHEMVLRSRLGAKAVAERVGRNYFVLLNELNPNSESNKLGADMLLPLMRVCGSVAPLFWLARRLGHGCFPLPGGGDPGDDDTPVSACDRAAVRSVQEFGEVFARYNEALANDGEVSPREAQDIEREADEAMCAIAGFKAAVRRAAVAGRRAGSEREAES